MQFSRRGFIGGLVAALATPAIVRASSLMPVRTPIVPIRMSMEELLRRRIDAATLAMKEGMARSLYADSKTIPMQFSGLASLFEKPTKAPIGISNAQYTWKQIGVTLVIHPECAYADL